MRNDPAAAGWGGRERQPLVDVLKALASQLIVWHHLAFYGPMSDVVAQWAPALIEALSQHGRLAVQVFLVVGGFLAARQLAPEGRLHLGLSFAGTVRDRYLRLVLPYAAMLVIVIGCTALARLWLDHHSLPEPADAWGLLAHLLLLQDLLDVDALSAGVWYVAIDFQLFVMFLLMLRLGLWLQAAFNAPVWMAPGLVVAAVAASGLGFNREPQWDTTAPYFFASYGLGVLAAWAAHRPRSIFGGMATLGLLVTAAALVIDFRSRIALAAVVAMLLVAGGSMRPPHSWAWPCMLRRLIVVASQISYSLFLVHFGVCLVVNAVFTRFLPATPSVQALGLVLAWAASVAAAVAFHRAIERPGLRWVAERAARPRSALGV